eukprot:CAMPEP_0202462754 /NCGR_PEP_ID=MMETSP1360-20130828/55287_1 /ASSEMBLY_ACC=CAM_ASM_000848 /TAXON_ID=515479 /ORGANISM="Licmophora paradoxa, Strain CCMP2313" /LENGTH=60 /DNA_ID=CAMNT_0049085363 /DNA_START=192 /DNA_END=374 /DNA_ORIENTATION=-
MNTNICRISSVLRCRVDRNENSSDNNGDGNNNGDGGGNSGGGPIQDAALSSTPRDLYALW